MFLYFWNYKESFTYNEWSKFVNLKGSFPDSVRYVLSTDLFTNRHSSTPYKLTPSRLSFAERGVKIDASRRQQIINDFWALCHSTCMLQTAHKNTVKKCINYAEFHAFLSLPMCFSSVWTVRSLKQLTFLLTRRKASWGLDVHSTHEEPSVAG